MLKTVITLVTLFTVLSAKKKKISNIAWELARVEGATDLGIVLGHPAAIKAAKMNIMMQRQDVVATCRYILFKEKLDYWDAREACRKVEWPFTHKGSWLADVHNEDENRDIRILLQLAYGIRNNGHHYSRDNWAWIGLVKTLNNDHAIPKAERGMAGFRPEEWEWLDGTHPNYTNWMRGMPDQEYKRPYGTFQTHTMVNKRGFWDDTFAAIEAPYICNYCGKYIVIAEHVRWDRAQLLCESYGLTMAIVNSEADNVELGWAANTTFGPIPEDRRWDDSNWIWLGTQEVMGEDGVGTGEWRHHDGSELGWSPFWDFKAQPDNREGRRGEQSVVAFSRINWQWDDSFVWRKRPFACMCPHKSCSYDSVYKGAGGM